MDGLGQLPILRKESVLERFRQSNCVALFIGFESINPQNRAAMGKQKVDRDLYRRQIERIHDKGIGVIGSFIFGFDEDTPETIEDTVDFCIESEMELTAFSALTPYPGTAVFKRMQEQGRLLSTDWRRYDSDQVLFEPQHFTPAALEQAVLKAAKRFYSMPSILKRLRFGMNYSPYKHYLLPNLLRKYSLMRM